MPLIHPGLRIASRAASTDDILSVRVMVARKPRRSEQIISGVSGKDAISEYVPL